MSAASRRRVSVIACAFNEEECVEELARRLEAVFDENAEYDFEAILVDNGSTDRTHELLVKAHESDPRFKVVQLARNFRMDGGITAGLEFATGDAAVLMAADLQDPPELITQFIRKWEEGYEQVFMVVRDRRGSGFLRRVNSRAFYWLAGKLSGGRIPPDVSDYRLVDRRVYTSVRAMRERNRFVRGLFAWVGFESIGIESERPPRYAGESKADARKVLDLALKGILAHSYVPLKVIVLTGVMVTAGACAALVGLATWWLVSGEPGVGYGALGSLGLVAFGILVSMLGVVAEYVGLIYEEVKQRPNFVVRSTLGLGDHEIRLG